MSIYARIQNGVVAELFETDGDIAQMFHADLVWSDITAVSPQPQQGWNFDGSVYAPPAEPPASPSAIDYIPAWLVRERLETANLWDAAVAAMSTAQQIKFCSLQIGIDPADETVIALLTHVGADPTVILAAQ